MWCCCYYNSLPLLSSISLSLSDHLFRSPLPTRHFKSNDTIDQQVLSIATSPPSLAEQYYAAEPKPALHVFDELWPDKRHALSLYSNPYFFFENWRRNMEREARRMRASRTSSVVSVLALCVCVLALCTCVCTCVQ